MEDCVAVIDIGMTNKKVAAYNLRLHEKASRSLSFAPLTVEGLPVHDLAGMDSGISSSSSRSTTLKAWKRGFWTSWAAWRGRFGSAR